MEASPVAALAELQQRDLGEPLRKYFSKLSKALGAPHPAEWPEDQSYLRAGVPAAIADVLIEPFHADIATASIAYLWKKQMIRGSGWIRLGKATRPTGKLAYLSGCDFVIEFNWTAWKDLTPLQRIALVDHELCHCDRDLDKGTWQIRHHDVEEFSEIIHRYGVWKTDLVLFAQAIGQLELDL